MGKTCSPYGRNEKCYSSMVKKEQVKLTTWETFENNITLDTREIEHEWAVERIEMVQDNAHWQLL